MIECGKGTNKLSKQLTWMGNDRSSLGKDRLLDRVELVYKKSICYERIGQFFNRTSSYPEITRNTVIGYCEIKLPFLLKHIFSPEAENLQLLKLIDTEREKSTGLQKSL